MFGFNPGNEDRSGEIIGQGAVNAAQTTAGAQVKLADDIGGSLVGLAGSLAGNYLKKKEMESSVKAGDQMINMFGDQLGITTDKLKGFGYNEMGLEDKYAMHQNIWGNLGQLSNLRMANQRVGIQQAAPYAAAALKTDQTLREEGPTFTGTKLPAFGGN